MERKSFMKFNFIFISIYHQRFNIFAGNGIFFYRDLWQYAAVEKYAVLVLLRFIWI